jgi:hypothetical protein
MRVWPGVMAWHQLSLSAWMNWLYMIEKYVRVLSMRNESRETWFQSVSVASQNFLWSSGGGK